MTRWLLATAILLALGSVLAWRYTAERAANPHRREMYERTLETARASCDPPKRGLESYCREQADLLLDFPECDPACVAFGRRVRGEPAR